MDDDIDVKSACFLTIFYIFIFLFIFKLGLFIFSPSFIFIEMTKKQKFKNKINKLINIESNKLFNKYGEDFMPVSNKVKDNIYYIPGILTDYDMGVKKTKKVKDYFVKHDIRHIYNPTDNAFNDFKEAINDYVWSPPNSGLNPTAYKVIAVLQTAKARNVPVGIIGSSQGSLITYNAINTFAYLNPSNKRFLKNKVMVFHFGAVLPVYRRKKINSMIKKYHYAVHTNDLIAEVFGKWKNPGKELTQLLLKESIETPKNAVVEVVKWVFSGGRDRIEISVNSPLDYHSVDYYLPTKSKIIKNEYNGNTEPFVKKNFFLNPKIEPQRWLESFLNTIIMT